MRRRDQEQKICQRSSNKNSSRMKELQVRLLQQVTIFAVCANTDQLVNRRVQLLEQKKTTGGSDADFVALRVGTNCVRLVWGVGRRWMVGAMVTACR